MMMMMMCQCVVLLILLDEAEYNIKNYPGIATHEIYIILHVTQTPNPIINAWPKQLSYQPSAVLNFVDICTIDINGISIIIILIPVIVFYIWSAVSGYKELGGKLELVRNGEMF